MDTFNNKVKIYLNGKLDSSHDFQLADKNATISGNTLTIGADPYNNHFSGLMYEPSLYYGAFSASKVESISSDVKLLCAYFFHRLNSNGGYDDVGLNSLHATVQGSVPIAYPGFIEFNKSGSFVPNNSVHVEIGDRFL